MPSPRFIGRATVLALVVVTAVGCKKKPKSEPAEPAPNPTPVTPSNSGTGSPTGGVPAGWFEARDTTGGFRVLLPGTIQTIDLSRAGGRELQPTAFTHQVRDPNDPQVHTYSLLPPAGVPVSTKADDLFAGLKGFSRSLDTLYAVIERSPVTLGGRPALRVVLKKKPATPIPVPPKDNPALAQMRAEQEARDCQEQAKRQVYYVTATGTRFVILHVATAGEPPQDLLKVLTDSFTFQ
ncbi:unnamed protein product [Gemmata massiliana]|uniref:Lipoprotein n=1 Tax=Gemmata massiliana TaxID=1210884 RepID=A0A6P2DGQ8_9BACT|nr:hypothetical protein [Gemmata massiliana]VTR98930.1 unnamed protein product [Gemmata massiliana]